MSDSQAPLSAWLQSNLGGLYSTPPLREDAELDALFDTVFARDAKITLNHVPVQRKAYVDQLRGEQFAAASVRVEWRDIIEVPLKEGADTSKGGIVAGFFVGTRSMKFRIRVGPAQQLSYNSFSAKIEERTDPGSADKSKFRITELFLTTAHKAAPIHMRGVSGHE